MTAAAVDVALLLIGFAVGYTATRTSTTTTPEEIR